MPLPAAREPRIGSDVADNVTVELGDQPGVLSRDRRRGFADARDLDVRVRRKPVHTQSWRVGSDLGRDGRLSRTSSSPPRHRHHAQNAHRCARLCRSRSLVRVPADQRVWRDWTGSAGRRRRRIHGPHRRLHRWRDTRKTVRGRTAGRSAALGVGLCPAGFAPPLLSFCERLFHQRDHTIEIFEEGRLAIKDRGPS